MLTSLLAIFVLTKTSLPITESSHHSAVRKICTFNFYEHRRMQSLESESFSNSLICGCPAQRFKISTSFIVDLRSSSSSSSTASDAGSSSQCSLSAISKIFTAYCRPVDFSIHRRTVLLTPLHEQNKHHVKLRKLGWQ